MVLLHVSAFWRWWKRNPLVFVLSLALLFIPLYNMMIIENLLDLEEQSGVLNRLRYVRSRVSHRSNTHVNTTSFRNASVLTPRNPAVNPPLPPKLPLPPETTVLTTSPPHPTPSETIPPEPASAPSESPPKLDQASMITWAYRFLDIANFSLLQIPVARAVAAGVEYTAWDRCAQPRPAQCDSFQAHRTKRRSPPALDQQPARIHSGLRAPHSGRTPDHPAAPLADIASPAAGAAPAPPRCGGPHPPTRARPGRASGRSGSGVSPLSPPHPTPPPLTTTRPPAHPPTLSASPLPPLRAVRADCVRRRRSVRPLTSQEHVCVFVRARARICARGAWNAGRGAVQPHDGGDGPAAALCVCGRGAVQLHDGGDGPAAAQLRPRVQPDGGGLGQKVRAQSTNLGPNRLQAVL